MGHMDRKEAQKRIKTALKTLTGRAWSVTGGSGTGWGWIDISVMPRERGEFGYMSDEARATLGRYTELPRAGEPDLAPQQGHMVDPNGREWFVRRLEAMAELSGWVDAMTDDVILDFNRGWQDAADNGRSGARLDTVAYVAGWTAYFGNDVRSALTMTAFDGVDTDARPHTAFTDDHESADLVEANWLRMMT